MKWIVRTLFYDRPPKIISWAFLRHCLNLFLACLSAGFAGMLIFLIIITIWHFATVLHIFT
jgi:hypothetical protein